MVRATSARTSASAWSALRRVGAAALGHVVLAAAAATERAAATFTSALADMPRARASSLTATTTEGLPSTDPMIATTPGRPAGSRPRTSSASLRTSPAPAPSARCPTNATPPTSSAPAASVSGRGEQLADPDPLDLLLRATEPLDEVRHPLGQLLGARLERLAELRDQHVLARQEAVGVGTRPAPRPGVRRSRSTTPRAA